MACSEITQAREAKNLLEQFVRREVLERCAVELTEYLLWSRHHDLPLMHIIAFLQQFLLLFFSIYLRKKYVDY